MSRPAVVYLVMIVTLVAGLWAVLAIGGTLAAPEDLAGKWDLQPAGNVTIEQSGKFFQFDFDHGPHLDLKLTEQSAGRSLLANGDWKLTINGNLGSDDKTILLTGPQNGQWTAHRVVRTFPADVSAKEGH